ncbi:GGDEF domain-containing protein [Chitinimonas sp.]|uniref:GGDEF domain-containing protein n=1 Tax=Chitinimonas sp. TaxID=1934313 RepID=UPI0035B3A0C7
MSYQDDDALFPRKAYLLAQTFFIQDNRDELTQHAHKYDFDMLFFDQMADFKMALHQAPHDALFVVDLDVLSSLQKNDGNRTLFLRDLFAQLPDDRDYVYLQTERQSGRFLLQQMLVESNCLAFADKPIANEKLVEKLFNLFARSRHAESSMVLMLGDTGVFDQSLLATRNIRLVEHGDAHTLHRLAKQLQPDVVIIDERHYRQTDAIVPILKRNLEADPSMEIILLLEKSDEALSRKAVSDGFDTILLGKAADILSQQLVNRLSKIRLNQDLISRDRATGLLNKVGFQQRAHEVIMMAEAEGKPLGLAVVDIDKFKTINDTWGHHFGDIVIKRLSLTLGAFMGPHDLLSRFGGEEFVVLVWDITPEKMLEKLNAMREAFGALRFEVEPGEFRQFSFSGGASFTPKFTTETALFLEADAMLYQAKQNGRNRICA